jgi:hypothetical protein
MTQKLRWPLLLVAVLALTVCGESGLYSGTLITQGDHTIGAGETLRGALVIMGGQTQLQPGARVDDSVYIAGGQVDINGQVDGNVSLIQGNLSLGPQAQVGGSLNVGGGMLTRAPESTVQGEVQRGAGLSLPSAQALSAESLLGDLVQSLITAVIVAVFAFLATYFLPKPVSRVAETLADHMIVAGAMGTLAGVVGLALLVLMAFTIILIPVTLLALVAMGLMVTLGWSGFGMIVGRRLARWLNRDMRPSVAAFSGTLVYMLAIDLIGYIPVVGGLLGLLLAAAGFGAVLLTRLGTRTFVPATEREERQVSSWSP